MRLRLHVGKLRLSKQQSGLGERWGVGEGRREPRLCAVCSAREGKSSDREVHDQELELAASAWAGAGECREPVSTTAPLHHQTPRCPFPLMG